jgi:intein/homing endonuclease
MLPTQKTPPRSNLSELTVLVHGPHKFGKCLGGKTILIDPCTGRPSTLEAVVRASEGAVLTMKEAGVIVPQRPSAYLTNEPAQLYRLTTQSGRSIEATATHPFLTRDGWKPLSQLGLSSRVAIVTEYPEIFGGCRTDDELLKILAYLIADGNIGGGSVSFTKNDPEVRMDFEAAVEAKGDECVEFVNDAGITHVRVRGKQGKANNVISHLKEVGLHGARSRDKFLPDFIFGLKRRQMRLFLNRLFTCDGSVEMSGRISYSSTSIRMVHQIQHLLARFGIVSIVRNKYLDGELYGAELTVCSKANVLRYIDEVGFLGEKVAKAEIVRESLYRVREAETQLDRLGPILFDRVLSIEPTEIAPVYDLTVDDSHNFVANDFVVHNSTWCSQADGALFLATEPGLNHVEVFQQPISAWDELLVAAKEIAEGKHAFRTIVIDTVDNAYRMCAEYICRKHEVEHESDLEYGKGYALVNSEFHRVLNKLALLPYGLFLVSHSQEKEIETRTSKYTKVVPTLPDKARKLVLGLVDVILFCDLEPTTGADGKPAYRRVLRTKPNIAYEAGDRTGRLPEVLDLNFAAFAAAFAGGAPGSAVAAAAALGSSPMSGPKPADAAGSMETTATAIDAAAAAPAHPATPASSPASSEKPPVASETRTVSAASSAAGTTSSTDSRPAGPGRSPAAETAKPRVQPATTATAAASSPRARITGASTTTTSAANRPRTTSTGNR